MKRRHSRQVGGCKRARPTRLVGHAARSVRSMPGHRDELPSLIAGRLAVIGAILAFMTSYAYGIYQYGWWLGLAVGWLPSMAFTWLSAQAIARGIHYMIPDSAATLHYAPRIRFVSAPFCCSGRGNIVPRYRQQDK